MARRIACGLVGVMAGPYAGVTNVEDDDVPDFYMPDLGMNPEDAFARDADGKLVRRSFWLDMSDRSVVQAMTQGLGANLANEHKRAHLDDIGRAHLVDQICVQEILPPE
jgi:hypothetical protein